MYKCYRCEKLSQLYEKEYKIITKKRAKIYNNYLIEARNQLGKKVRFYTQSKELAEQKGSKIIKQFTTKGWEIEEQKILCKDCYGRNKR